MEPDGLLPRLQVPATSPYAEPDQSTPYPQSHSWRSILLLSSYLRLGFPSWLFPLGFPTKTLYVILLSPKLYSIWMKSKRVSFWHKL